MRAFAGRWTSPSTRVPTADFSGYAGWPWRNGEPWPGVVRKKAVESDQRRVTSVARARLPGVELPGRTRETNATAKTEWLMAQGWSADRGTLGTLAWVALTLATVVGRGRSRAGAGLGARRPDPAQVVPLDQIAPEHREIVSEVIRDHTFHRQGESESFPCPGSLYLSLLNEPLVPLTLWKDLSDSPVQLQKVGPNRYQGTDGSGSTAVWDFVLRTPRLHVLLAYFNYVSPHGNARIDARIVLIVHSSTSRDSNKEPWVQHDVEAFVKVDSKGWKTLARTVRPVIERILEEQVREAGYFVSLMSRLVVTYPNWACQVVANQPAIDSATKQRFQTLVVQTRRPGASKGRPTVAQNLPSNPDTRRR